MKHSYAEKQIDINDLIDQNLELVRKIAWQIHGRARNVTDIQDIIQIGYTGLILAAQKYTPQEGVNFSSYASIRIRGAIVDFLRKNSNLCRTTIQIKKRYNEVCERLEKNLLRKPYIEEIALEMNMGEAELLDWETAFQANIPESIESVYDQFSIWFKSSENNPEEQLDEQELHNTLKKALTKLPEREALVIQLYYVEELNVFEIAEVLNVSTGRISQIKKGAIKNLRDFIDQENQLT